MKKKELLVTTLIFLMASTFAFTQEYEYVPMPTKNAVWSNFEVWPSAPDPYKMMNYIHAIFDEDTVIYNDIWQKVFMIYDSVPQRDKAVLCGFVMEKDKVVYYYSLWGTGGKLYDFNANVGDTVITDFDIETSLIVTSIDTILLGNKKRKRIKFLMSDEWLDSLAWIEGVGSTNGLLHSGDFVVGTHNTLLCFKQENDIIYYNNKLGECYPDYPTHVTGINNETEVKEVTIFPNPANETFNIQFNTVSSGKLIIYNIEGKVMNTIQIKNTQEQNIQVDYLEAGVYIIGFKNNKDNALYRNTLIINK